MTKRKPSSHHIPAPDVRVDTSEFAKRLHEIAEGATGRALDDMEIEEGIYRLVYEAVGFDPNQPHDNAIVCRFLTPEKFLWFLHSKAIYFGRVDGFDDPLDCAVPEAYASAVAKFYLERKCAPVMWEHHADAQRSSWLISCWNEVDGPDNDLLWHKYARGPLGVGITVKYGVLREALERGLRGVADDTVSVSGVTSGYVAYEPPLIYLPFNKRHRYRNEQEVRFVADVELLASHQVSVDGIFSEFGIRFSPDSPRHHRDAIANLWRNCGGADNVVVAGS